MTTKGAKGAELGAAHARRRQVRFRHALVWLLIGAVVYAVALAIVMLLYPEPRNALAPVIGPSLYLTPLFGGPYLIASMRQRGWMRRVLYFTLLLTFAHIVANNLAWRYGVETFPLEPGEHDYAGNLITGAIGGFSGAVLAFALLMAAGLTPRTRATRGIALIGVAALTLLAAVGMAHGLAMSDAFEMPLKPARFVFWYECVHFPWQACLAFFLAWLMRLRRSG